MHITPLDIRKHEFRKTMRGYDVEEVNAFLDLVSVEYENMIRENALLNEKVKDYSTQLKKYHDIEGTLQETLLSAERAREETVKIAKKQGEVIVREAEVKAAAIIEDARKVYAGLRNAIISLRSQKEGYVTRLKALITAQLDLFDRFSFDEDEVVPEIEISLGGAQQQSPRREKRSAPGTSPDDDDLIDLGTPD